MNFFYIFIVMPEHPEKKTYSPENALVKARAYCVYQERCHQEVRDKLYEWGLWKDQVELAISELITEGFLNEERFAITYAGGKFRIKKWGKVKIKIALKAKKVSDYCIKKALSAIDDKDYTGALKDVIAAKSKMVKEPDQRKKNYKVAQYAISRGFEAELVWGVLTSQ